MANPQRINSFQADIDTMDAIHGRQAVRNYTNQKIDPATIRSLLDAAVHAPTAVDEEPWAFVVVQDKKMLNRLSDAVKELVSSGKDAIHPLHGSHSPHGFSSPEFNAFYNAETLILICGKPSGPFVVADCWLAAENLMLAAYAQGLGSCVIGLAVSALNTQAWKKELCIPESMTVFVPIIAGMPAGITPVVPRKPAEILSWKK